MTSSLSQGTGSTSPNPSGKANNTFHLSLLTFHLLLFTFRLSPSTIFSRFSFMDPTQFQTKEVHLLDYLNLIRKRKWILIACVFIGVVTAIIINHSIVPIFEASCQIIFEKDSNRAPLTGEDIEYVYYFESPFSEELTYNTQLKIITSYEVLKRVAERLGLLERNNEKSDEFIKNVGFLSQFKSIVRENIENLKDFLKKYQGKAFSPKEKKPTNYPEDLPDQKISSLISALQGKISVNPVKDTRLVNITVKNTDPVLAATIANGVAKSFIDYDGEVRSQSTEKFLSWITEQISEMKEKIDESERKFYNYKMENRIFSLKEKQDINTQKIVDLNSSYIDARTERLEIQAKILKLENLISRRKDKTLAIEITNDSKLKDIYEKILQTKMQLYDLKQKYKDKHLKVVNTLKMIETFEQEYDNALNKTLEGLYFQDEVLKTQEQVTQEALGTVAEEAFSTDQIEFQYSILEREVETNKVIYNTLINKLKETKINVTMKKDNMRITEPAQVPGSPLSTQKNRNNQLGVILGLLAGLGLIFLLEYLETGIKTEEDARQYLGLPVIGIIPEAESKSKNTKSKKSAENRYPLVSADTTSSVFSEAFRSLRTNIFYSLNGNGATPCKIMLVTSSIPSEGKSTTATNLALTLAMTGESSLLIDTDLRVPSIYKQFNLDRKKGLTNILVDLFNTSLTEGSLEEYGLGDLISLISIQGKSGVLHISDRLENFQLFFREGELVDAQWKNRPEDERLGEILVISGKITEEQKRKALRQQDHCRQRLGSILLNMNLLDPKDLQGPLELHFSSIMNRIFALREGRFTFHDNYIPQIDTLNHLKNSSPSWQEALYNQATPFLEKNILSFINEGPSENLKILTTGPLPSNPSELLNSRRLRALIHVLRGKFNYIIMDSPPVNSVTDASILASLVDGVIQVVHVGRVNRNAAKKAKQQLDSVGAKIFGVVLNRLNLKKDGYYYYSYYYYNRYGEYYRSDKGKGKRKKEKVEKV